MEKQAGDSELTLLENICQEKGKTEAERGREKGEKKINNNVENDSDDHHS